MVRGRVGKKKRLTHEGQTTIGLVLANVHQHHRQLCHIGSYIGDPQTHLAGTNHTNTFDMVNVGLSTKISILVLL